MEHSCYDGEHCRIRVCYFFKRTCGSDASNLTQADPVLLVQTVLSSTRICGPPVHSASELCTAFRMFWAVEPDLPE